MGSETFELGKLGTKIILQGQYSHCQPLGGAPAPGYGLADVYLVSVFHSDTDALPFGCT